jgi:hypothetical protein
MCFKSSGLCLVLMRRRGGELGSHRISRFWLKGYVVWAKEIRISDQILPDFANAPKLE